MFVSAPRRNSNGTTTAFQSLSVRVDGPQYNTRSQAQAQLENMNFSDGTGPAGETRRQNMQNGIVSYKKYKNTAYNCLYRNWTMSGRLKAVYKWSGKYQPRNVAIRFGTIGFHNTGFSEYLDDLNISTSSSRPEALLNKVIRANLVNRAKAECLDKINDQRVDLGETLVGLPQSIKMIADRLTQVLIAFNQVRKRDYKAAINTLRRKGSVGVQLRKRRIYDDDSEGEYYVENTQARLKYRQSMENLTPQQLWLEISYGWVPLLADIHSAIEFANGSLFENPDDKFTVVRRVTDQQLIRQPVTSGNYYQSLDYKSEGQIDVEVRYRWSLDIPNPTVQLMKNIGLMNPFYVMWVAVPWTFVIDWLIPVGTWLQAIGAPYGLRFTSGYVTEKTFGYTSVTAVGMRLGSNVSEVTQEGESTAYSEILSMRRTPLYAWPLAVPYFRNPFGSQQRVASAIALLTSSRRARNA